MKRFLALLLFGIIIYPLKAQYTGGNNDGFSSGLLSQTSCPPFPADLIYYGGINDGFSSGLLSQTSCTPYPADFIYYGGINDGFSSKLLDQIANCLPVLPIELLTFTASCEANTILLKWSTATELNNDYFTIERSDDAINFEILSTIDGAGNSTQILNYSYVDQTPLKALNYYRLKQTDFNGKFKYSNLIALDCTKNGLVNDIRVYPNPANFDVTIDLNGNYPQANLELLNSQGQLIYSDLIMNKINLNINKFTSGLYLIKVTTISGVFINKLIIELIK
ncbi:MAG: T9SS type A sorting domain-containing protein [Sphingobacteriaceae bacterium]